MKGFVTWRTVPRWQWCTAVVPGKVLTGMGGAMDLVMSGCKTVVLMEHVEKGGRSRVVQSCSAPLTATGVVDVLITELCTFRFEKRQGGVNKMWLAEVSEGVTVEEVRAKTEAAFDVDPNLKVMPRAPPLSR
ncbi:Coenzyme A transferase [Novymonas esmeraldas]|uniref:Coenzyme A transferase n=1 Tax=Novymonas esmeraldas TaxID=1808958 RepID=A0AAW0F4E5_9TRYP